MRKKGYQVLSAILGTVFLTSSVYTGQDFSVKKQDTGLFYTLGSGANDVNFTKQWAFENDGTFELEEEQSRFPVYENPFEDPVNDGNYTSFPDYGGYEQYKDWMEWIDNFFNTTYSNQIDESIRWIFGQSVSSFGKYLPSVQKTSAVKGIDINMPKAWEVYNGGKREVIVALIDTGTDITHEDLADAIWINEDEIPGDGIDNDGNGYIDDVYGWNFYDNNNQVFQGEEDSHGTHGAGTIAAALNEIGIAGIAGNSTVKVMVIKALGGKDGAGTTESIIRAIQYAEDNGAVICNLSFGTSENNRKLKQVIQNSNMLFVAAAGNGDDWTGRGLNADRNPVYPAAYNLDNIISVANLNYDGTLHSSSNYGNASVDLAAPGSYILSTTPQNTYSYMTGTSMAAPMVTGVAALLYSQYEDITLDEVREIILASAKKIDNLNGLVATGGMLDAYAALTYDRSSIKSEEKKTEENSDIKQNTDTKENSQNTNTKKDSQNADIKEDSKSNETTNAPKFSFSQAYDWRNQYLIVTVTDKEDDIVSVRYESGKQSADYFKGGTKGNEITLDENYSTTFLIKKGGTYTFYAVDKAGNETVKVITITR